MKVIFAGTPDFAAAALAAIINSRHQVVAALTQPDRPAGRGMKLQPSPVKQLAESRGLSVQQPASLKDADAQARLRAVAADVMVVAAYGLILPQAVLDMPRRGAINIHASLLPRWRGAAPIQRALLAGDDETGICIMQMDAGLDTGPVLLRDALKITVDDDAQTLHDRLAAMGAAMIVRTLDALEADDASIEPRMQVSDGATYARKIEKAEARIDWRQPAEVIDRHVRAFRPFPGAVTRLGDGDIKIWRVRVAQGATPPDASKPAAAEPGTVLQVDADFIRIGCGGGALDILELQKAGGKKVAVRDFLRGHPVPTGSKLGD
jgi:methionyl-tRNA formyltransferase